MILKIIGAIVTVFSFSALGFYFSNELKVRLWQMRAVKKYITILRGDIRYGATPLPEALSGLSLRTAEPFRTFFKKVSDRLLQGNGGTFAEIWSHCVEIELQNTSLKQADKDHLVRLGEHLGYLDREMQMNTIDLYLSQLEEEIREQAETVKERVRIYNLLGLMAGLFVTIIMI